MSPRLLIGPSLVLSLALSVSASPARADDRAPDPQAQAQGRALFDEGVALAKQGKWAEACTKFETSLRQYPGIGTRGKLAECYEKLNRFASAWTAWKEVAQLAMRAGEPTREQIANERAKALEPKLSYVTTVLPPANDVPGLVIKRNGRELDRAHLNQAEPVDAGAVGFEVSAPGKKAVTLVVLVQPGQSGRFEVPPLEVATSTPAASSKVNPVEPSLQTSHAGEGDATPWQKPVGLALAGVGVVGVGVGGLFGLSAKSTYKSAFDTGACDKATKVCSAEGQSSVDSARSKATLSTVFFVAGAALAAGGLVLFFTAPEVRTGVRVVPVPYASGGGVVLAGAL